MVSYNYRWTDEIFTYLFLIISATGLYYLAELVEEYTVIAKKIITWMVISTISMYIVFIFTDDFPWHIIVCGLGAQGLHFIILKNFPYVKFMSVPFIGAVICLIYNHYVAFIYFQQQYHSFSEVRYRNNISTKYKKI